MDHLRFQTELLRYIRGSESRQGLADRLRCEVGKIYRYETGRSQIDWRDFVSLCHARSVDIKGAMRKAFGYTESLMNESALVRHFIGNKLKSEVARDLGISRSVVSRWLGGKQAPSLFQVLKLISQYSDLIEKNQDEADKVYLFTAAILDFDHLPMQKD